MRKSRIAAIGAVGFTMVVGAKMANAQSIGINISGPATSTGEVLSTANLGVTGHYQQSNWNNIVNTYAPTPLTGTPETPLGDQGAGGGVMGGGSFVDSTGASLTGFNVTWAGNSSSAAGTYNNYIQSPANSGGGSPGTITTGNLYNGQIQTFGYLPGPGAISSLQVTGIPYSSYSIVVYSVNGYVGQNFSSGTVATGTVSTEEGATGFDANGEPTGGTSIAQGTFDVADSTTWTQASDDGSVVGNYYVISGLSGSNQTVTWTGTGNLGGGNAEFDEFAVQIVNAVPEPASLSLLGIAGLGLLRRRRRA